MRENLKQFTNTKQFHICMVCSIMFIILFITGVIILKYSVEGEDNLPFDLSKISIFSIVEGTDVEDNANRWNLKVSQNNDVYLYIKKNENKNENYENTESIKKIVLENFKVKNKPNVGSLKLYKPDSQMENKLFKNISENETDRVEFIGDMDASLKDLKISNQGGLVIFRYSVEDLGNYVSNDDNEINHDDLLKKLSINNDDIKFNISFDILMELNSRRQYKANVHLDLPINDIVNDGTQSIEYTDLKDIIFRRI